MYVYRTAWRGLMWCGVVWRGVARCRHGSCQTAVQGFLPAFAFTIIARTIPTAPKRNVPVDDIYALEVDRW